MNALLATLTLFAFMGWALAVYAFIRSGELSRKQSKLEHALNVVHSQMVEANTRLAHILASRETPQSYKKD